MSCCFRIAAAQVSNSSCGIACHSQCRLNGHRMRFSVDGCNAISFQIGRQLDRETGIWRKCHSLDWKTATRRRVCIESSHNYWSHREEFGHSHESKTEKCEKTISLSYSRRSSEYYQSQATTQLKPEQAASSMEKSAMVKLRGLGREYLLRVVRWAVVVCW